MGIRLFFLGLALFVASCAGPVPPVPTVSVDGFDPEVRDVILTAQKQALAEPSNGQASGRFGMALHAHAVYPTAALAYLRSIRLEPKEFAWRYYLALVDQQLSQPDQALDALSAALRIRPDYLPAQLRKADVLFQLGRLRESEAVYKPILEADPASASALYGMARVKYAEGDASASEDFYGRACRAFPTFGAAYYGLGTAERGQGHEAEAAKNFELAQRYSGDTPQVPDPMLEQVQALATGIYYRLAKSDQLAKKGNMEEAARLNEQMLERDPENFGVLLNLLYLARFVERLAGQADALYSKARQINPQVPLVYDYYGAVLARQGKFDAATAAFRKALELKPDYAEAHAALGEILEAQNRPDEAIEQYRRAQPPDSAVQLKLWRLLILHGRGREAIPELLPALEQNDSYAALRRVLLGEAYLTAGDVDAARQYLEQARTRAQSDGPPGLAAQIDQELAQLAARR
jgi:tetratricopeptide (TPR) repeat protein